MAALTEGSAASGTDVEATSSATEQAGQPGQASPSPAAQSEPMAQSESDNALAPSDSEAREELTEEEPQDAGQEAQAANIPSLEEYLSGFTCGSCRRNCSLDNPRCHNGSRLAQAKAQEYYSMYG